MANQGDSGSRSWASTHGTLSSVQASQRTLATQQAALQAAKDSKLAQDKALTELVSAENQAKQQWDALQQQANEHTLNAQKRRLSTGAVIPIRW